ncbi:MAG: hypothetical protein U9R26_03330, partial [Campylobacterota bacterium]|nr:hypothetical protein [Campylobacterota bacterium]
MIESAENEKSGIDNKETWRIINALNLALVFVVSYSFISMQVSGMIASDIGLHMSYIKEVVGELSYTHPLWHMGTHYLSRLLGVDYGISAALLTASLITLYAAIIYKIAQSLDSDPESEAKWYLVTMIALTIGPFFLVNYYSRIYMGAGSPSVWHNVTLTTVQPLALLSVFFTIKFFASNSLKYFILAVAVTMVSIFAKPNFIIVFLPSLVVYMLLRKNFDKRQLQFAFITILFSVAILAYQLMSLQESNSKDGSSMIIDCLGVWSKYTPSVSASIAMALGLPFLISLFNYSSVKKNEYIKFTWLLVLFSTILFACFAESGKRYIDGNFSWSWMISLSLIYIFTIIEYFKQYFTMPGIVRYPLLAMMLYQVYVGWYFVI